MVKSFFTDVSFHVILEIMNKMDFISLTNLAKTCRQNAVLVHIIMQKLPSIITSVFNDDASESLKLLERIQATPTMAILLDTSFSELRPSKLKQLVTRLPSKFHLLYSQNPSIEISCLSGGSTTRFFESSEGKYSEENTEYSIMLGAFPEAICSSFLLTDDYFELLESEDGNENNYDGTDDEDTTFYRPHQSLEDIIKKAGMEDMHEDWKVFIIYTSNNEYTESIIQFLQNKYPKAAICGGFTYGTVGIASHGSFTSIEENGIACLAMRGNVPIRVVVSRGVESVSDEYGVLDEDIEIKSEESTSVDIILIKQVHLLLDTGSSVTGSSSTIIGSSGSSTSHRHMDPVVIAPTDMITHAIHHSKLVTKSNQIMIYLGVRNQTSDLYHLLQLPSRPIVKSKLAFVMNKGDDKPTQLQFFCLTPTACKRDVYQSMALLKDRLRLDKQVPMATIMFSCSGRGPRRGGFFSEDSVDATAYTSVFPGVPLMGSYVNGEIGPQAGAGVTAGSIVRSGTAVVQGFTAVFGVFTVPQPTSSAEILRNESFSDIRGALTRILTTSNTSTR